MQGQVGDNRTSVYTVSKWQSVKLSSETLVHVMMYRYSLGITWFQMCIIAFSKLWIRSVVML